MEQIRTIFDHHPHSHGWTFSETKSWALDRLAEMGEMIYGDSDPSEIMHKEDALRDTPGGWKLFF